MNEQLKKNAEFVLAKFAENFEITKVTPFAEVIDEELGNDLEFSFEIKGIPFTVTVSSDEYVDLWRDDTNAGMGFPIEDLKVSHFFENINKQIKL